MRHDGRALLISIRPRFADLILNGDKTVELRRTKPSVKVGDSVLLYASSPICELIGTCIVLAVDVGTASDLWNLEGSRAGLTKPEFDSYFQGAVRAVGISLREARRVRRPRTLAELRVRLPGFTPPQSFSYLTREDIERLDIELEDAAASKPPKLMSVPSAALTQWRSCGLARLVELENVHATLTGPRPGRRWGTTQLNRSLFVALVAQFQSFCRDLHDEATKVHVDAAIPGQRQTLHLLIRQGRKLDTHNPRRSTLGHDFARLGFSLIDDLKATGPATVQQLDALDLLIDYRNAVGHGDEAKIGDFESGGGIKATKKSYLQYRRALDQLATTLDATVTAGLASVLGVSGPR